MPVSIDAGSVPQRKGRIGWKMCAVARICVYTHREPEVVGSAVMRSLLDSARDHGVELVCSADEAAKHPLLADAAALAREAGDVPAFGADAALVLAGDGTLLRILNDLRGGPPVLGVNFGMLGYLSGTSHERIGEAIGHLAAGTFRTVELPALEAVLPGGGACALNDVVASGGATGRIIELGWRLVSTTTRGVEHVDDMAITPCDGMVVATPVGSTAYNLSNGGPVMAWGVEGFVVSFIAPHTLAARPLVVAPDDAVEIEHMGRGAQLKVFADGQRVGQLQPGESMRVRLAETRAQLALVDDVSFYARYREHFAEQIQSYDRSRVRPAHRGREGDNT
jgi:NAD+ kinase